MQTPFPHSYWVVPGKLLAGHYPGSKDLTEMRQKFAGLIEARIRRVINLQEENERDCGGDLFVPYAAELQEIANAQNVEATMRRMPIRDMGVPSHVQMRAILDEIDQAIAQNQSVYVHCWAVKDVDGNRRGVLSGTTWIGERLGRASQNQESAPGCPRLEIRISAVSRGVRNGPFVADLRVIGQGPSAGSTI